MKTLIPTPDGAIRYSFEISTYGNIFRQKTGPLVRGVVALCQSHITIHQNESQKHRQSTDQYLGTIVQDPDLLKGWGCTVNFEGKLESAISFWPWGPNMIATWNVCIVYDQGRCETISKKKKEYNIEILGFVKKGGYKQEKWVGAHKRQPSRCNDE